MKNIFIMILLVTAIVGSYFVLDFGSLFKDPRGEVKFVAQVDNCDLHNGPCSITLEDGKSFSLEVFPKDIPLMKPLKFRIISDKYDDEILPMAIYSTNMNMGTQLIELKKIKNNEYESTVILPTCIRGNMNWNADIVFDKISHRMGAKFKFKTDY